MSTSGCFFLSLPCIFVFFFIKLPCLIIISVNITSYSGCCSHNYTLFTIVTLIPLYGLSFTIIIAKLLIVCVYFCDFTCSYPSWGIIKIIPLTYDASLSDICQDLLAIFIVLFSPFGIFVYVF